MAEDAIYLGAALKMKELVSFSECLDGEAQLS